MDGYRVVQSEDEQALAKPEICRPTRDSTFRSQAYFLRLVCPPDLLAVCLRSGARAGSTSLGQRSWREAESRRGDDSQGERTPA